LDDIEKHKKKIEKSKKIELENFKKPKSYGSLDVNDILDNFEKIDVVNIGPKSTKLDEPILERVEPYPRCLLSVHFYPC